MNTLKKGIKHTFLPSSIIKELGTLNPSDYIMMGLLLVTQIGVYIYTGLYDTMSNLSLIVGVVTIINLILINRGRITNYAFGTISSAFWFIVAFNSHLIGDMFSQAFYLIMQIVGVYVWQKSLNETGQDEVAPKKITIKLAISAIIAFIIIYAIVVKTSHHLNGQQIWLDSTLLPLAIISQLLMTYGFRSQWIGWITINLINVYIWYNVLQVQGNAVLGMFVLQIVMLVNSLYGAYIWFTRETEEELETPK